MDDSVNDGLPQRREWIVRLVHPVEPVGSRSDAHVAHQELLGLIDVLRQRAVQDAPVQVPDAVVEQPPLRSVQGLQHLA